MWVEKKGFTCERAKTRRLFLPFNFHDDFSHIIKMAYHDKVREAGESRTKQSSFTNVLFMLCIITTYHDDDDFFVCAHYYCGFCLVG